MGEELPDLGNTPGPLAAIWMVPRKGGGAPEAVGLVAETGTFGTLPINLPHDDPEGPDYMVVALSADGRRIAYTSRSPRELIVRDLVSGEKYSPRPNSRPAMGSTGSMPPTSSATSWGGSDGDGWVWEPGTATAPKLVDPYLVPYGGTDGFDVPALPSGVVTGASPERITFAADLIGAALDADGGAS